MSEQSWWRGAVIYQIYPRSFMDANNDGIGDLAGIVEKLPYVKSLGVDAIWISPFFKSPMKDFGYDISDYRQIDPMFGNIDDFDLLMANAKKLNLKIIIDQVLSHTSDQHAWFLESRANKNNDKSDWYVWADAKADGTPPNNWLSIFGGSAWQWEPRRQQYYLHNFLDSQPDLNFHNDAVRQHVLDNVEFWLKHGVDGFRLDAINFCFHDKLLRDNPAKAKEDRKGRGFSEDNPYAYQYHYFDNTQPENLKFMEDIRRLINNYPDVVTLGEISSEDSLKAMSQYTEGNRRLHMAYSFELLNEQYSPAYIRQTVEELEKNLIDGWPCWAIGNHDVTRVISRWGQQEFNDQERMAQAKMLNAMLMSLRGSVCSYQGEELGLTEATIAYDDLQDPYGIAFWPQFKGRDGCRTPMPWISEQNQLGFSDADKTWLPVGEQHNLQSVNQQDKDLNSVLNAFRAFVVWRKQQPALLYGDIRFLDCDNKLLTFIRSHKDQRILTCFNFTNEDIRYSVPKEYEHCLMEVEGFPLAKLINGQIKLSSFQCVFLELKL